MTAVGTRTAVQTRDRVTIRFAGDSGDGMQLAGNRFTDATAIYGNDFSTLPDFPAEIRAPAGSLAGVSAFQINFSRLPVFTPGDQPDALVAMNPAALKTNLPDLERGGLLILNKDAFTSANLKKAGYARNPLEDGSLSSYRTVHVPVTTGAIAAAAEAGVTGQDADRTKNFFALGLVYWLFDRDMQPTYAWIDQKFGKRPKIAEANRRALRAGYDYGDTAGLSDVHVRVAPAQLPPGLYRSITGNEATALGLLMAMRRTGLPLVYASYPITPASDILHELAIHRNMGVKTVQAEDEMAAVGAAIGAAFGGALGVTGTSGPGLALKSEFIGLAVMAELPVVVLDIQRVGPSTGIPTKTEQGDLLQAMFGRNSESPVIIVAPDSPSNCFDMVQEAVRLAYTHMAPAIYLSDNYVANSAEPWLIPDLSTYPPIPITFHTDPATFQPYGRNPETLARLYARPGTPGLEHRIGGLEKTDGPGTIAYDAATHQHMTDIRREKVARVANDIPELEVEGPPAGAVLVLSWGSAHGPVLAAAQRAREKGYPVSTASVRYLNPFPRNLGAVLQRFQTVLIPENNDGQLLLLIRGKFLVDAKGLHKVSGQPFTAGEIEDAIIALSEKAPHGR